MEANKQRILIVDDEKNIRLTLCHTLEMTGYSVETAVNGEDALQQLEEQSFDLVLLDLKMPGMDGAEVLAQVNQRHPDVKVIIVTAHGTVDNAVEAMKTGAMDFIQKPFAPQEIRELVAEVLDREGQERADKIDYEIFLDLARRSIAAGHFDAALEQVKRAIAKDAARPEAFNLLGVIHELRHERSTAMKNYRIALDLDPTYEPAHTNMNQSLAPVRSVDRFDLGA